MECYNHDTCSEELLKIGSSIGTREIFLSLCPDQVIDNKVGNTIALICCVTFPNFNMYILTVLFLRLLSSWLQSLASLDLATTIRSNTSVYLLIFKVSRVNSYSPLITHT